MSAGVFWKMTGTNDEVGSPPTTPILVDTVIYQPGKVIIRYFPVATDEEASRL